MGMVKGYGSYGMMVDRIMAAMEDYSYPLMLAVVEGIEEKNKENNDVWPLSYEMKWQSSVRSSPREAS
jgi:hypothetical protein